MPALRIGVQDHHLVALGIRPADAPAWSGPLSAAAGRYRIDTPPRLSMWLAQLAHESAGFRRLEESLSYSAERLVAVWPRRFPTLDAARPFAHNPEALANMVYGGRLGNDAPGDGYRYRGRGLIQLTGRANYAEAARATGRPLVDHPELATDPPVAADVAGWYWQSRGCNPLADAGDLRAVTRKINGGLVGLEDRRRLWVIARRVLV